MVLPVLTYGSEVWGFHAAPDIERVHLKLMKRILGVRPQTTNTAVYGELGRVPLNIVGKERILKYWFKIIKSEGSPINKLFKYQIENNNNNDAMWADQVKSRKENPQKLTQLSSRSHPIHLVGKRTA